MLDRWIRIWSNSINEINSLLVLAGSKTAEIEGVSSAGATKESRRYTAVADAELTITQIDQRLEYHKGRGTALDTERYNELMEKAGQIWDKKHGSSVCDCVTRCLKRKRENEVEMSVSAEDIEAALTEALQSDE